MIMENNAFIVPELKSRIERFLRSQGLSFNDFLNGLLVDFVEEHGIEDEADEEWKEFDRKMQLSIENDSVKSPFVVETREDLTAALDEAFKSFDEGKFYTAAEVDEMLLRNYGIEK